MIDQVVTYKTAKLAKELGFEEEYGTLRTHYYNHEGILDGDCKEYIKAKIRKKDTKGLEPTFAPTQSLLQKWLREKHNINVIAYPVIMQHNKEDKEQTEEEMEYFYIIYNKGLQMFKSIKDPMFDTYEEALEEGLKSGLNLIGYEE